MVENINWLIQKTLRTFVDENFNSVFGTGNALQNDLTISGGNENSNYFFSLGHLEQDGIIKNSSYERTNARFKL